VLAAASAVFLTALLFVYLRNHRELRSPFTLGLVFFAVLLLVQNLGSIYFDYMMSEAGQGSGVAIPMLVLNAAELIGFAALFFVTWR
jgi:hypothetical protein